MFQVKTKSLRRIGEKEREKRRWDN